MHDVQLFKKRRWREEWKQLKFIGEHYKMQVEAVDCFCISIPHPQLLEVRRSLCT